MKTTLDIPDAVFRRAKAKAALSGISLRQLVTEALEQKMAENTGADPRRPEGPPWMRGFGALSRFKAENRRIEALIEDAFENIGEDDRT